MMDNNATRTSQTGSSQKSKSKNLRQNDPFLVHPRKIRKWLRSGLVLIVCLLLTQTLMAGSTLNTDNLSHSKGDQKLNKALILTAHPDDEVMFFAPAILNLVRLNIEVYALCLSNGNADGLGRLREEELLASYANLGVRADRIRLVSDDRLQDGMQTYWDPLHIVDHVEQFSQHTGPFDLVFTFDKDGISSHANHKACSYSIPQIYNSRALAENGRIYSLRSQQITIKYLGLIGALVQHLHAKISLISQNKIAFLSTPFEYLQSLRAMSLHKSQMVWFRYLYLLFSIYMYGGQFDLYITR